MRDSILLILHKIFTRIHRYILHLLGASTVGVRAIVINTNQEVLIVKHTYRPGWFLPGGGVKNGETAYDAIKRELYEETGIILLEEPILYDIYFHVFMGVNDYPITFIVKKFKVTKINDPEIEEIMWCPINKLPLDITPGSKNRINEFSNNCIQRNRLWN